MCLKVIHSVAGFNIDVFLSLDHMLCLRCGFSSFYLNEFLLQRLEAALADPPKAQAGAIGDPLAGAASLKKLTHASS